MFLFFITNTLLFAENPLKNAKLYTQKFYGAEYDFLIENFSDDMKAALPKTSLVSFRNQILDQFGQEKSSISEKIDSTSSIYYIYEKIVIFEKQEGEFLIRWVLDDKSQIYGFLIIAKPKEADSKFLDYECKTDMILPFNDEFFVFWGGRNTLDNYHAAYPDQRFAYDFLQMKKRRSFKSDGKSNEDYYCFGKDVIAPGYGVIVEMKNDVEDNIPGVMNPKQTMGNYVIIDHLNGEYSFIAHFKKGSIIVAQGDTVKQAQLLGLCGNSGNSSEAHIHYHLQNTAVFGKGEGLPIQFNGIIKDSVLNEKSEAKKGEQVKNSD